MPHSALMYNGLCIHPRVVGMMLECNTGGLLAMAALMHDEHNGHAALALNAALKGLTRARSSTLH